MIITDSPWGEVQYQEQITQHIATVITASHGGVMIEGEDLQKLSGSALAEGMEYDEFVCYEEDCAVLIPINEIPEVRDAFRIEDKADFEGQLKYWYPDYYKCEGVKF